MRQRVQWNLRRLKTKNASIRLATAWGGNESAYYGQYCEGAKGTVELSCNCAILDVLRS